MARFDVYANPDQQESRLIPFYFNVHSDHVKGLQTQVVVPLWRPELVADRSENINPQFDFSGQRVVTDTPEIGAASAIAFKQSTVNLGAQQLIVQDALDTLFGSY